MAQNHAGAMRLGGQAKERQLLQGAVFPVAKQTWPAKSHLRRRRFSAHRHLPHAQGRNHSPGPRLRLFRPASSRNQGEAVGKPDRQAWLRSHLAAHRQGGLKCKKERRKNQCLNVLFLFRSEATKQSSLALWFWIASRSLSSGAHSRDPLARNDVLDLHHLPRLQRYKTLARNLFLLKRRMQGDDRRVDRLVGELKRAVVMRQRLLRAAMRRQPRWPRAKKRFK